MANGRLLTRMSNRRTNKVLTAVLAGLIAVLMVLMLTACGAAGNAGGSAGAGAAEDAGTSDSSGAEAAEDAGSNGEYDPENAVDADAYYDRLMSCKEQIEQMTDFRPDIAIVLGSGLGDYVNELDVVKTIPYEDIDGWPESTAPGHKGNLVLAKYKNLNLAIMQGRVHYYEGYTMPEVVLPLRVLYLLGAHTCILTNAAGAINADYSVGDFVCVKDQITSFVPSPLIGQNIEELGEKFVPMTDVFDKDMQKTVLEVIAAAHMNMRVCAINCISNMAAGMEEEGFSHDSIKSSVKDSAKNTEVLISGLLDSLAEE